MGVKLVGSLLSVLATIHIAQCYVLVMRKGENQSDVDAFTDTALPTDNFQETTQNGRRQFIDYTKYRVKKNGKESGLNSVIFALNLGNDDDKQRVSNPIVQSIVHLIKKVIVNYSSTMRRNLEKFNIKPKIVQFKNGKSTRFYEINLQKFMNAAKDVLNMNKFRRYSGDVVQFAATLLNSVKDPMKVEQTDD